jgi:hypothetical protein
VLLWVAREHPTKELLSLLKRKYHPCRKITYPERHPGKKMYDWIDDSETEGGVQGRPFLFEGDP